MFQSIVAFVDCVKSAYKMYRRLSLFSLSIFANVEKLNQRYSKLGKYSGHSL